MPSYMFDKMIVLPFCSWLLATNNNISLLSFIFRRTHSPKYPYIRYAIVCILVVFLPIFCVVYAYDCVMGLGVWSVNNDSTTILSVVILYILWSLVSCIYS